MDSKRLKIITKSKRVKQSSKEIEDRFNSLLENNPDSICSLDLQGKFTSVNPATERITGYSTQEILNHSLKSFITKENIMKVLRYFKRTAQGESQNYEVTITHKEGHRIELSVKNVPIIVRNKIVGVYIIAKDITQRKQMEEQLRESENNYRFIAKNMSDLIIVLDETGVVQYASPSHKRVLGFSPTVYEGRMVFDLVHPEDISFVQNIYKKMIITKLPHLVELRYKHSNGDWIAVEANGMPVIGGNGEVINVVVVAREITKRRQAEEALQESEKQLRTLINALPDGAFLKDGEGRWLEANHAGLHLFQLGNAPYKGKRDTELAIYSQVAGEAFLNCQRSDEEAWKAQRMIQLEEVIPQPDGVSRTFDVIKVPTFYPDGKRKGIVVIGRDITERKKTEEIIRKTDKLAVIGELAAGIAHEIRNHC
ncbi:PAS domain S-box protein [Aneurinibacillus tyrosinisolvens]|uniref:PAS domain S-box protein n=1 Tax=Aneurinibacillus tyrosinisolvens TaxID=1443435 RepID=UPI00063F6BEA|nr:PAS domain S-box protein [Aneurinibacillus tyrosinisolvens]